MSAENNDKRTLAAGPADAGQQAGGLVLHPDYQVARDKDPEETGAIVVLLDPRSPLNGSVHHQGTSVSRTWILLDNQSTADVFHNLKLLDNVRKVNKVMNINCNAGVTCTAMVGDSPGHGEVWLNKSGTANILSLSRMEKKHRITCDSENGKQFIVHKDDGMLRRFRQSEDGLFCMDAKESDEEQDRTVLVNKVETVEGNKKKCTKAACKQAKHHRASFG
jgi:hypothetical protein